MTRASFTEVRDAAPSSAAAAAAAALSYAASVAEMGDRIAARDTWPSDAPARTRREAQQWIRRATMGPLAVSTIDAQAEVVAQEIARRTGDPALTLHLFDAAGIVDLGGRVVLDERAADLLRAA